MTPDERAFVQSLAALVAGLSDVVDQLAGLLGYDDTAAKARLVKADVLDALNELEGA
jgi:hypothetical protein